MQAGRPKLYQGMLIMAGLPMRVLRRRRVCRAISLAAGALALISMAVIPASFIIECGYGSRSFVVGVGSGSLGVWWGGLPPAGIMCIPTQKRPLRLVWLPTYGCASGWCAVSLPLWPVVLLMAIVSAKTWRKGRAVPAGCCARCEYDLRGSVSERCPECGSLIHEGHQNETKPSSVR